MLGNPDRPIIIYLKLTPMLEREYIKAVRWILEHDDREAIGDYLEFGVFYGSSLTCMYRVIESFGLDNVRFFGFDSFEGLPKTTIYDDQRSWRPEQFKSNFRYAQKNLNEQGINWNRVFLVKGCFSDTLNDDHNDSWRHSYRSR
ncbi:hypothetical protein LCGC14_2559460 [marine sediment metagenome]|uniref:Macrocin O-methyltransferase n=1 Tax=marine sediment metagenome TaxID=412755 RepID=A0A0F9AKZ6_9ZZZZ